MKVEWIEPGAVLRLQAETPAELNVISVLYTGPLRGARELGELEESSPFKGARTGTVMFRPKPWLLNGLEWDIRNQPAIQAVLVMANGLAMTMQEHDLWHQLAHEDARLHTHGEIGSAYFAALCAAQGISLVDPGPEPVDAIRPARPATADTPSESPRR